MNKLNFFILLLFFFLLACAREKDIYLAILSKIEENDQKSITSYANVIILPELGCEGCISDVEDFLISYSQDLENTFFILTRIKSLKLLKLRIGEDVLNQSHVYLDMNNLFEDNEIHSIYPIRLELNNQGEIEEILAKDPTNTNFFNDLY